MQHNYTETRNFTSFLYYTQINTAHNVLQVENYLEHIAVLSIIICYGLASSPGPFLLWVEEKGPGTHRLRMRRQNMPRIWFAMFLVALMYARSYTVKYELDLGLMSHGFNHRLPRVCQESRTPPPPLHSYIQQRKPSSWPSWKAQ